MSLSKKFSARFVVVFFGLFGLLHVERAAASPSKTTALSTLPSLHSTIGDQGTKGTGSAG